MKLHWFRFAFAAFLFLFAASAAMARSPILKTRCAEDGGNSYSLYVTVPSGGYELSVTHATVKGVLTIALEYAPPSGPATQALVSHRLRFTVKSVLRPSRYVVLGNGKKLGRAKPINLRDEVGIN